MNEKVRTTLEETPVTDFASMMRNLCEYFGFDYKLPRVLAVGRHLEGERIPDHAWPLLCTKLKNTLDGQYPMGGNLGKRIIEAWRDIAAGQGAVKREKKPCDTCGGSGSFSASRREPGEPMPYLYTKRCSACENWVGELGASIQLANPFVLEREGWKIVFNANLFTKPMELERDAAELMKPWRNNVGDRTHPGGHRRLLTRKVEENEAT